MQAKSVTLGSSVWRLIDAVSQPTISAYSDIEENRENM